QVAVGTKQGFVLPGDGDANWPAIMQALRRIGYDGPMVAECKGDLADISARMDRILNDGTL
ncbi:MAG: hypothetical protein FWC56_03750, partial [Phycisphaerae bacterium]|nr:hypothetical protein [Phycisphaerae bacterium]